MKEWSVKEVLTFLEKVELIHQKETFYRNKIKGKDLIALSEEQLKGDLGMNVGDRKKILGYLSILKEDDRKEQPVESLKPKKVCKNKFDQSKLKSLGVMKKTLKTMQYHSRIEEIIE